MATHVLMASASLSSSAGSWRRAEASNFASAGLSTNNDLNTVRTQDVTFANAGNQAGICLFLYRSTSITGTLTIKLQEYSGGSWVDRTSDSFPLTDASFSSRAFFYFALTSYAVTTAASTWRYSISYSVSGKLYWYFSGSTYIYFATLDVSTAKPGAGDTIVLQQGAVLTQDESATFAQIVIGDAATFQVANPAGPYTLTLTSANPCFNFGTLGALKIGSEAAPISVANRFTISLTDTTAAAHSLVICPQYSSGDGNATIEMWGAEDDYLSEVVSAQAAAGQDKLSTTRNLSATWAAGDTVQIAGKLRAAEYDTVNYTLDAVSASQLDLSANLDYAVLAGAHVVNLNRRDRLGIWILGTFANQRTFGFSSGETRFNYVKMVGCYWLDWGFSWQGLGVLFANACLFRCILQYLDSASYTVPFFAFTATVDSPTLAAGSVFQNLHRFASRGGSGGSHRAFNLGYLYSTVISNLTIKNAHYDGATSSMFIAGGSNIALDNVVSGNCKGGLYAYGWSNNLYLAAGTGVSFTDCLFYGSAIGIVNYANAVTMTRTKIEAISQYGLVFYSGIDWTVRDSNWGKALAAGAYEVYLAANAYVKLVASNSYMGAKGVFGLTATAPGTYLRFDTYNNTAGDHRGLNTYGNTQATGDGLTDTTVHTAAAGKFALRFEPTSSANNLVWSFDVPTGNITSKTMTLACWVKINNAAFYAGTHQKPRLSVNYDNGTVAYAEAAGATAWQLLSVTFTPATSYGQITVTVSGRTDATGANAYFYVDDFAVLYPAGYRLDLGGLDLWANALPIVPPIATVLSAGDVWLAADSTLNGVGTIGKRLVDTMDAAVSSRLASASYTAPPSAAAIADAVLDEDAAGHNGWLTKLLSVAKFLGLK